MRCLIEYIPPKKKDDIPVLRLFVHGAPHRRQHIEVIQKYREVLLSAAKASKMRTPIKNNIELRVTFIDPCSCDLDNLISALYRAMDGYVLEDDSLIHQVVMDKYYPCNQTRSEPPRSQKVKRR